MQEKYKTLIAEKTKQNDELVLIQTEKISLARALIELKLQHSNLLESVEKDKFELTSALLEIKNENFELENTNVVTKVCILS